MPMPSAYMPTEHRKKVVTYGKAARLATTQRWGEDAASAVRLRTQTGSPNGTLYRPETTLRTGRRLSIAGKSSIKSPVTRDIFDVPSDDEGPTRPSPSALDEPSSKTVAGNTLDVPSSNGERPPLSRKPASTTQPSRNARAARPTDSTVEKTSTKPEHIHNAHSTERRAPQITRRAKTPQITSQAQTSTQSRTADRIDVRQKAITRRGTPTTSTAPAVAAQKKRHCVSRQSARLLKVTEVAAPKAGEVDIFDVPLSDDDVPPLGASRARPAALSRSRSGRALQTSRQSPPVLYSDSDGSNSSKKRKRQASESSSATVKEKKSFMEHVSSVSGRSRKHQKVDNDIPPGHGTKKPPEATSQAITGLPEEMQISKPKRTRLRTVPLPLRPPLAKGKSSPAKLNGMLVMRSIPQPAPVSDRPEVSLTEDETMYDIPSTNSPSVRPLKASIPGSVTPRQKALFDNLLGDCSDSATPMPSISKLYLTDRRPGSTLSGLTRSSSDIPQSGSTRKSRLIDALKKCASTSDEDSESDEETGEVSPHDLPKSATAEVAEGGKAEEASDKRMTDSGPQHDSQASQTSLHLHGSARITYARQRSYLPEADPEEGLLLAMDLDDDQNQGPLSEDEDDPASQVRGIHELRRQGQHYKFQVEAENAIDDIAGKGDLNPSQRRGAMMDFATRMADSAFIGQLLESALASRLLESISYTGETVFDFAAVVAVLYILEARPSYTVFEQVFQSGILLSMTKLLDMQMDIHRIARDRKTNMARSAQASVAAFRALILESSIWANQKPEKLSPRLVSLKTLELLVLGLRKAGNTEPLADENTISKLVSIADELSECFKANMTSAQDLMTLDTTFSLLEAVSLSPEGHPTWSNEVLRSLAEMTPVFFEADGSSPIRLVIRLCMNITNNKPKACQAFAGPAFVIPLVRSICHRFKLLAGRLDEGQRTELMEDLTLSLGAMINLAEFSDAARMSVIHDGYALLDELAQIFLEGSERADHADSMEESQSSVAIGYLTILLGNLCLHGTVRARVQSHLPGRKIDTLVQKVKEFVLFNQRVDRLTSQFEGDEGKETLRNFTTRLMLVVEKLERAGA